MQPAVARQRDADLHAGRQRQRHGDRRACGCRTTAAPPTAAWTPRPAQTFTITVTAVNDAPSLHQGRRPDRARGRRRADRRRLGDGDHRRARPTRAGQTLELPSSRDDQPTLCSPRSPTVAADGTLTYTPAANANGIATVERAHRRRRRHRQRRRRHLGHARPSPITVTAVNDAPSLHQGRRLEAVPRTPGRRRWPAGPRRSAPAARTRPAALAFEVTANTHPTLFAAAPADRRRPAR